MESNTQPNVPPIAPTLPQPVPAKPKTNWFQILFFVLLGLIVLSGFLFIGIMLGKGQTSKIQPTVTQPTSTPQDLATPTAQTQINTLKSIDDTWNLYTNNKLKFSMKIPKVSSEYGGVCVNGKLDTSMVPVKTFDDDQGTYITYESFYEYPKGVTCQKVITDLKIIQERANQWKKGNGNPLFVPGNWHIITAEINDDAELESFIKTNYGTGCKLGTKTLSSTGVYDVKVLGDGLDLDVTKCPINFVLALKYSPEFKKAATWGVGQGIVFSSADGKQSYDMEIINSFKFIQ